jgi:hypothetical protein
MSLGYALVIVYSHSTGTLSESLANTLRALDNIVAWFQLLAISYSTILCLDYNMSSCKHCKVCKKKLKWDIPIFLCFVTTLVGQFISDMGCVNSSLINGVNLYYAVVHTVVVGVIIYLLLRAEGYDSALVVAYIGIWINNLIMIGSLLLPPSCEETIRSLGSGLMQISGALLIWEVLKLLNKERGEVINVIPKRRTQHRRD